MKQRITFWTTCFQGIDIYMSVHASTPGSETLCKAFKMSSTLNTLTNASHNALWNPFCVLSVHVCAWGERVANCILAHCSFSLEASFHFTKEAVLESWLMLRGDSLSHKHCSSLQRLREKASNEVCAHVHAHVCTWVCHDWAVIVSVQARATWKTLLHWLKCRSVLWLVYYIIYHIR